MTPEERAELRRLAAAATPGPWRPFDAREHGLHDGPCVDNITGSYVCETATDHTYGGNQGWFDAAYIAAANPAAILRLLDELDRLESR